MGAILAEICVHCLEHNQIYAVLIKHQIIGYFRYIDDILIIYDNNKTHTDTMLMEFKTIHLTINFTREYETDKKTNFLDLTIQIKHDKLNFTIYRKPTSTDILIHNNSCNPNEHKLASINYLTS
jgi:hypothetical protein